MSHILALNEVCDHSKIVLSNRLRILFVYKTQDYGDSDIDQRMACPI
ncbi:MAG: hypothetical protein H6638_04330 [Ardenticatenales bacterium]|nr:hypothetical protein [Ardenticatenales bacterium]